MTSTCARCSYRVEGEARDVITQMRQYLDGCDPA
jgi:hypothetical protein